jgi:hypothetical protein
LTCSWAGLSRQNGSSGYFSTVSVKNIAISNTNDRRTDIFEVRLSFTASFKALDYSLLFLCRFFAELTACHVIVIVDIVSLWKTRHSLNLADQKSHENSVPWR